MMLAAIKAMADSDPVWQPRRHNADLAAKAATMEMFIRIIEARARELAG